MIERLQNFVDIKFERHEDRIDCYSFGGDPQCEFKLTRPLKRGWYYLDYTVVAREGNLVNPKLYIDYGHGYSEQQSQRLSLNNGKPCTVPVHFTGKVNRLRFDPTESGKARFSIYNFSLKPIGARTIFDKLMSSKENAGRGRTQTLVSSLIFLLTSNTDRIEQAIANDAHTVSYQNWINKYDFYTGQQINKLKERAAAFAYRPLISIVVPTYNTPQHWLRECLSSIVNQVYDNWELCISDDGSSLAETKQVIEEFSKSDARIKCSFSRQNTGIAAAGNKALALATGEFVAFVDHDDVLHPLALFRIAESLNEDKRTDFFYSDEDKLNATGERVTPFFKPDWSPSLLYVQNYIGHLACIRKRYIDAVQGFSEGSDGSQDYDLFLKVCARGAKIRHLPYILYHWRQHDQSTSSRPAAKPFAQTSGKAALEKYFTERFPDHFSHVEETNKPFVYKPRFRFDASNRISIIIPTKDKIEYLKPCIESIIKKSSWKNFEIIILNNNSAEAKTELYFEKVQREYKNVRVVDAFFEFNWSKLNNFGTRHATGNYLIFLNNDIAVISPDWMEQLCEWASLPEIATVGANLLYPDRTIQHAGVVVGMNGWADHVFKNDAPDFFSSSFVSNNIPRNVLANTGACVAIERKKFEALGWFDEDFIICGSDVELGIRAYKNGLFNVVNGYVQLFHYESKSRGSAVPDNDFVQSALKYEPYRTLQCDPFYNPNLSLNDTSPICKS